MVQILRKIAELLKALVHNEFFVRIQGEQLTEEQWKKLFIQKYGSVAFFVPFLERGILLCKPHAPLLTKVFSENLQDELGYVGGIVRNEYAHETWRLRSLLAIGVLPEELKAAKLLPTTEIHSEFLATLSNGDDFLEYCGALLFLEIWIAREMKELIKAFERTMPHQFPKGGYLVEKIPLNTHEYWYNHRDHDPEHFRLTKEALANYLSQNNSTENTSRVMKGIEKVYFAKQSLYSKDLIEHLLS
jgi:pyrroloquinoline quinone (PQQ) biosynthesis protein C